MSAESYGAKLLGDVEEESLASLLAELRVLISPERQLTGVTELDELINGHRSPVSRHILGSTTASGSEHPQLLSEDDLIYELYNDAAIRDSNQLAGRVDSHRQQNTPIFVNCVVEGSGSAAAARSFFDQLTCVNVLPEAFGGRSGLVVYIDCSSTFTARQLHKTMYSHIRRTRPLHPSDATNSSTSSESAADISKAALQHVHVIPCTSSRSLLDTLTELPGYLLDRNLHHSFSRPLTLLLISGINIFHWQDRLDAEVKRLESLGAEPDAETLPPSDEPLTPQIFNQLKALQVQFGCPVIYFSTSQHRFGQHHANSEESQAFDIYSHNALFNLQPSKRNIPTFAPSMTIEDCLREQKSRQEAVTRASNMYYFAASPGGQSTKRQIRATNERSGFTLRTFDDGGVAFESMS